MRRICHCKKSRQKVSSNSLVIITDFNQEAASHQDGRRQANQQPRAGQTKTCCKRNAAARKLEASGLWTPFQASQSQMSPLSSKTSLSEGGKLRFRRAGFFPEPWWAIQAFPRFRAEFHSLACHSHKPQKGS